MGTCRLTRPRWTPSRTAIRRQAPSTIRPLLRSTTRSSTCSTRHLLPENNPVNCFPADGSFVAPCAAGARLSSRDFIRAGSFLAGAADKTGVITVDLVQYMNRILKITLDTELSTANVLTLPALIRDCGGGDGVPYLPIEQCTTRAAADGLPTPANERFVNFRATSYVRNQWHDYLLEVLQPLGGGTWQEVSDVRLMDWLSDQNGPQPPDGGAECQWFRGSGLRSPCAPSSSCTTTRSRADLWDFVLDTPSP